MGIRDLARRVKHRLDALRDEARHPGQPQSYGRHVRESAADPQKSPEAPSVGGSGADAGDTPWYLQNPETEGWDHTNPNDPDAGSAEKSRSKG